MLKITRTRTAVALSLACAISACAPAATVGTSATAVDRSRIPEAGPTPTYDFPDVQRRTLSNGLPVWIVERPGVPLVTVQLLVDAGAVADPSERIGLASLTAAMLTEGTTVRSASQIADELAFLAANLTAGAGQEIASVSMTAMSRTFDEALDIFADVVVDPAFTENDWSRIRDQRLISLVQALDQPATIATQQFGRLVYGTNHPLGRPIQGTPASVRATNTEALRAFHRAYYHPRNANLIVVGDVSIDRLVPQLETAFASWHGAARPEAMRPSDPPAHGPSRIYLIDKPGSAQSEIRIGHVGVERGHRDYFPLLVMNTILGGQFSSRINLNLREDKGYTYGARSQLQMGRLAGPFVASAGVQTAVTKESIAEFMRELTEIRESRPVTEEELDFARASIIRREPLTLETNAQIANRIQDMILYDLPPTYFDEYNQRIAAVSRDDVNRVAREYLHPQRLAMVVVGDRAVIESSVRELQFPVEVVVVEGVAQPAVQQNLP